MVAAPPPAVGGLSGAAPRLHHAQPAGQAGEAAAGCQPAVAVPTVATPALPPLQAAEVRRALGSLLHSHGFSLEGCLITVGLDLSVVY